jgi:diguanylate cyclase (GGDEF)-like protein
VANEFPISHDNLLRYLELTRDTVALRCSPTGVIEHHNDYAGKLLGNHGSLLGEHVSNVLCQADRTPLDLETALGTEKVHTLALLAKHRAKVLQGVLFAEDGKVVLIADVIGDQDDVSEQLGTLANEISDISRDLRQRNRELEDANRRITELSRTDTLTGLANRRYFLERMSPVMSLAERHKLPLALIMADLDYFKRVNDTYGHETGDQVLRCFAETLRAQSRHEDMPCRFGGEEFLVLLPQTRASDGRVLAERIRTSFADATKSVHGTSFTASFGVASVHDGDTVEMFIARADAALYVAKSQGRNRTAMA